MKKAYLFNVALLLVSVLFVPASRAQDYTRRDLPEGALRLGKGSVAWGDRAVAYSPDGTRLAVASNIGVWLYDAHTYPPADISVPLGFAVERWSRSEPVAIDLITNREYGTGIIGATVLNAASDNAGPDGHRKTRVVIVEPNGEFRDAINIYDENSTQASIEFISQSSYPAGAYIYDADIGQGQSFYRLDESFNLHLIASHTLPAGRSDIDPMDLKADPTGKYGGLLTLSDTDLNHERLSGLYQLQADGEWQTLVPPAPVSEHQFQGIAFSNAGPLGSGLYVADAVTDNIWIASPKGHIEAFAIGFAAPKRVANGIYLYRLQAGEHVQVRKMIVLE